ELVVAELGKVLRSDEIVKDVVVMDEAAVAIFGEVRERQDREKREEREERIADALDVPGLGLDEAEANAEKREEDDRQLDLRDLRERDGWARAVARARR